MQALQAQTLLTERLRDATRSLHTEVERAGVMRLLLRGQLGREDYCRLLVNLHAIYVALEAGLHEHGADPGLARLPCARLFRSPSLHHDLTVLHGPNWKNEIALESAAVSYAEHLRVLAANAPLALAAHAYVRYLGDLSGGQVLARIVANSLDLMPGEGVGFYDFGSTDNVAHLAQSLRVGLNQLPNDEASAQMIVTEACSAFARHRNLFEQLAPAVPV